MTSYTNITGISRAKMKDNSQESFANYAGNARPGELIVDLSTYTLYVGNSTGALNAVGGGGGGSTTWATLGDKNNASGPDPIALGLEAGNTNPQGVSAVAIGAYAGADAQGDYSTALGYGAGSLNQGTESVAIGVNAGGSSQGGGSVAVGSNAGGSSQRDGAVAIGYTAAMSNQGMNSVAIGTLAGGTGQANGAVAIGYNAGFTSQGANAVAVGSYAGMTNQHADSIVLNASGNTLNTGTAGFFVAPVRNAATGNALYYDTASMELTYAAVPPAGMANFSQFSGMTSFGVSVDVDNGDILSFGSPVGKTTVSIGWYGSPADGQRLTVRFSTGSNASLTWDPAFRSVGPTLPASVLANKIVFVEMMYNAGASVWDVFLVSVQP